MKKIIFLTSLLCILTFSAFSQEQNEELTFDKTEGRWTNLNYVNIPILKILEGKDGYVVIYQKNRTGVGSTIIPKNWAKGTKEDPRKLKFRNAKGNNTSYMTIVNNETAFQRVILTIPMSKQNSIWGLYDYHKQMDGLDKENLEDIKL
ncbi:MAG: hypothetical protein GX677_06875 [Treponema sp.]|jgi:hypothetical protein|nr:hypothetical protein [Treponema sp.]